MKIVTLERRFFVVNAAGDNEFDWVLEQLGIKNTEEIDEVEVKVESFEVLS